MLLDMLAVEGLALAEAVIFGVTEGESLSPDAKLNGRVGAD